MATCLAQATSLAKAICTFALSIIPDHVRVIEEVQRVRTPAGRFVVLDVKTISTTLPRWLHWMLHICAVDMGHQTLEELRCAFTDVQVHKYWVGFFFIAVAKKG